MRRLGPAASAGPDPAPHIARLVKLLQTPADSSAVTGHRQEERPRGVRAEAAAAVGAPVAPEPDGTCPLRARDAYVRALAALLVTRLDASPAAAAHALLCLRRDVGEAEVRARVRKCT